MALSREKIVEIVGAERLADHQIVEIIESGADEAALMEAYERCIRPGELGLEVQRPPSQTVSALVEILAIENELPEER